ncbi:hypothetical protein Tco_1136418 [Tanacetum coccineum]
MSEQPPTKAQKRNTMSTYLKNMAGYKHNEKRAGEELMQESEKKQKVDDDKETAELKSLMKSCHIKKRLHLMQSLCLITSSKRSHTKHSRIKEVVWKHPSGDYKALNEET